MPTVLIQDTGAVLGLGSPYNLSYSRALLLLAIATSPSPLSRYRPASRWTIAKYSTVCDPRRGRTTSYPFTVNPGIADLDPHQKAVLSDDIGMAIALGLIDENYGIVGLADAYAMHSAKILTLKSAGKHRSMPDFVLELRKPIAGSTFVLLECKGSVTRGKFVTQLGTACNKQLENVDTLFTVSASSIPKIASATELLLGNNLRVHFDDPPQELEKPLSEYLQANLLALEYSLFNDLVAANAVWKSYGMPTFTDAADQLPSNTNFVDLIEDDAITPLGRAAQFKIAAEGAFEQKSLAREGYAFTQVRVQMSTIAKAARLERSWAYALNERRSHLLGQTLRTELVDDSKGNDRRIMEDAVSSTGIRVSRTTRAWYR